MQEIMVGMSKDEREALVAVARLAKNPYARRIAEDRLLDDMEFRQAIKEAEEAGERNALAAAIERLCKAFGIELSASRQELLASASVVGVRRILDHVGVHREWPTNEVVDGLDE